MSENNGNLVLQSDERYVKVTPEEAKQAWYSAHCVACGKPKDERRAFCKRDFLKLPAYLRSWIMRGPADHWFAENFRRALQHLRDVSRVSRLADRSTRQADRDWPYATVDEVYAAGYKSLNASRCRKCLASILWMESPSGARIPVDARTKRPHGESCGQAAQTSAQGELR